MLQNASQHDSVSSPASRTNSVLPDQLEGSGLDSLRSEICARARAQGISGSAHRRGTATHRVGPPCSNRDAMQGRSRPAVCSPLPESRPRTNASVIYFPARRLNYIVVNSCGYANEGMRLLSPCRWPRHVLGPPTSRKPSFIVHPG